MPASGPQDLSAVVTGKAALTGLHDGTYSCEDRIPPEYYYIIAIESYAG